MSAEPESAGHSGELEEAQPSLAGASPADERLLDAVMCQTAAALDEQTLAQTVDLPRLREVARRHPSDSLTLDPILCELIEAILETHLSPLVRSSGFRTKIARAVAQPLFDNPVSRGRLELLWSQLLDNTR